mgnify:CR=1 FL=1
MIDNGLPGLLKGDFNVCYEPNQLTFIHFIMDGLEAQEREILRLELCYRMYRNKLRDKCKHTFNQPNIRILEEIMKKCMEYYTQLWDVQVCIDDDVKKDRDVFLNRMKIMYHTMWHNH